MQNESGRLLRGALVISAVVVTVIGLPLWGSYPGPLERLGLVLPANGYADLAPWRAIGMSGLFGGALLALAASLVALALSRDHERLVVTAPIVLVGMFLLNFIAFAKVQAFNFAPAGYWMVAALLATTSLLFVAFVVEGGRRLVHANDAAAHAERTRLARDLHDSVKQQLYSVHAHLAAADARWDADMPGARLALGHARTGTRDAMREMAALLDRLQTSPVEAVGLVEALRRQCDALGFQTGATVSAEFGSLPTPDQMDAVTTNALFRIGQEALANIARHARPSHVIVFAGLTTEPDASPRFVLRIEDDGQGFDPGGVDEAAGMGLRNLRTRADDIGARLVLDSAPGRSTSVEVEVRVKSRHGAGVDRAMRWFVGIGLPTLALAGWSAIWPEWRPFLGPIVTFGLATAAASGAWALAARWRK